MNEHPAVPMTGDDGQVITLVGEIPTPEAVRPTPEERKDPALRNQYRASLIGPTMREYADRVGGGGDIGTTVQDMLADLMHLCDATEVNFDAALGMARNRYDEEIAGE